MKYFLGVVGFLMVVVGLITSVAGNGTYQLSGVVAWCSGFLLMGLAGVIAKLEQLAKPPQVPDQP